MRCCSPPESSPGRAVAPVEQADALEQLCARATVPVGPRRAAEAEREADELLRGQVAGERPPVVLVGVADDSRAVAATADAEAAPTSSPSTSASPADGRSRPATHADERRLARAARTEHDADLAPLDPERQPAQRGDAAVLGRVDDEHVAQVDERAHPSPPIRPGPRGSANARRVVHATSATAATANAAVPSASVSGSTVVASGGSGASALAVTDTTRVTRYASAMPASAPTAGPDDSDERGARGDDASQDAPASRPAPRGR